MAAITVNFESFRALLKFKINNQILQKCTSVATKRKTDDYYKL